MEQGGKSGAEVVVMDRAEITLPGVKAIATPGRPLSIGYNGPAGQAFLVELVPRE